MFYNYCACNAELLTVSIISGVSSIYKFLSTFAFDTVLNKFPIKGISPNIGTFLVSLLFDVVVNPPILTVSPSLTTTFVLVFWDFFPAVFP